MASVGELMKVLQDGLAEGVFKSEDEVILEGCDCWGGWAGSAHKLLGIQSHFVLLGRGERFDEYRLTAECRKFCP